MYKINKINSIIGQNIAVLRKTMKMKQEAFAHELNTLLKRKYNISTNYDCKTISKWESGQTIPKIDVLIVIAKEFGLSLDELLKNEIQNIVSTSCFSSSEELLLNEFIDNEAVCQKENGKYISSFNPDMYRYGQLSYLVDNLIEYRGELSKNFSFTNPTKYVQIIVGIMDVNDNKRELHYLGKGDNDIVSIEQVPINYITEFDVKNNNVIKSIMYNEITHGNYQTVIKLGNGKTYIVNENESSYNSEDFNFEESNIPKDLDFYEINKVEYNWLDYACLKGHRVVDDDNLFDFKSSGVYFYKKSGIFEIVLFGNIKCSDEQMIKILADDYKHRLIKTLESVSDDAIFKNKVDEITRYLKKRR